MAKLLGEEGSNDASEAAFSAVTGVRQEAHVIAMENLEHGKTKVAPAEHPST